MSEADEPQTVTAGGVVVRCPVCGGDRFRSGRVMVSTGVDADVVVSATGKRSWTGRVPDGATPAAQVCARCRYVLLFAGD